MSKIVAWFEELSKDSIGLAGGKGANLGEMASLDLPVPPGFVVTAPTYTKFLQETKLDERIYGLLGETDVDDSDALNSASQKVRDMILETPLPDDVGNPIRDAYNELAQRLGKEPFVAVRSSATAEDLPEASFAGQQETYLNIKGADEVVKAVQKCWASLFTSRAIFYREKNDFPHDKVAISAVVQKMVNAELAGVMFTVHPATNDTHRIMVEGAYGLGETVVSGTVTPDTYVVKKGTWEIEEKTISKQKIAIIRNEQGGNQEVQVDPGKAEKQKIPDKLIVKLAKLGKKIADHYHWPQDIEWAIEDGQPYILQTRPVTTLGKGEEEAISVADATVLVQGMGASPGVAHGGVKKITGLEELSKIKEGDVMVTTMTTPDMVPAMKRAVAIITDEGGMTSHAAIVSRELGIPCIVGTSEATKLLSDGQVVTVNAGQGIVYQGVVALGESRAPEEARRVGAAQVTGTKIYVNLGAPGLAEEVSQKDVDGVGLMRAEFILAEEVGEHPRAMIEDGREEEFVKAFVKGMEKVARAFYPRPVIYRALDLRSNEFAGLKGGSKFEKDEANPMIGFRGCQRYVQDAEVFELELQAIKKVRSEFGMRNLHLMIPFVRTVDEFRKCRTIVKKSGLLEDKDFKLWIMVEVPSTVALIDRFCEEGIDGISIGSNDLTQLTLGADRDNALLSEVFDERNEAVMRSIERVVRETRKRGVTSSICGQAPSSYPDFAAKLVEFGITSISVNSDVIDQTRRNVASAEKRVMLDKLSRLCEKN